MWKRNGMNLNLTLHAFGCFAFFLVQWWLLSIICYVVVMNNASSAGFYVNENTVDVCQSLGQCVHAYTFHLRTEWTPPYL